MYKETKYALFFHVRHDQWSNTLGKIKQIYASLTAVNKTDFIIGLEPQCLRDWNTQLTYFSECSNIPVMLNVFTSDENLKLDINQITQIVNVCPVRYLRFHEVISYYRDKLNQPLPLPYVQSILSYAKENGLSIFWSEWDVNGYPTIASIIKGYEDYVAVSFGTNNNSYEPSQGFKFIQQFKKRGASIQSWYWWERHGRESKAEIDMPPQLMAQHTNEALAAGCEVIQYEPFWYFFNDENPKTPLAAMFAQIDARIIIDANLTLTVKPKYSIIRKVCPSCGAEFILRLKKTNLSDSGWVIYDILGDATLVPKQESSLVDSISCKICNSTYTVEIIATETTKSN